MPQPGNYRPRSPFQPDTTKLNPEQLDCYNRGICVVCLKNKGRTCANLFCDTCNMLTIAEKTRQRYGAPKEPNLHKAKQQESMDELMRLVQKGLSLKQMSEILNQPRGHISARLHRGRRAGYPFPRMLKEGRQPIPIVSRMKQKPRTIEHGGGKFGVKDCPCDPCRDRRLQYNREWRANKKLQAQQQETPPE